MTKRSVAFNAFIDGEGLKQSIRMFTPWHFWMKIKTLFILRQRYFSVKRFINTSKPILDVGGEIRTNIGQFVPNETVILNIKKNAYPSILASATHLPIRDKAFELSTCLQTFHQIKDDKVISELLRVTKERVIIHDYLKGQSNMMLTRLLSTAMRIRLKYPYMMIVIDQRRLH